MYNGLKIFGLSIFCIFLLALIGYFLHSFFDAIIRSVTRRKKQKKLPKLNLNRLSDYVLLTVELEADGKINRHSFVVYAEDVDSLVNFFIKHHSDPGIDLDSGRRNCLVLNRIYTNTFRPDVKSWITTSDNNSDYKNHKFPNEAVEVNKYQTVELFSKKEEELKPKEEKLADIIPIR